MKLSDFVCVKGVRSGARCLLKSSAISLLMLYLAMPAIAQEHVLDIGIRLQKSINLYTENGITLQYSSERLASEKLYLGVTYVTSRLGTAIQSNAIKQDNYLLSAAYLFRRHRLLRPLARLNVGYFVADYEADIFDDLPNSSLLASTEAGICIDPALPLKVSLSLGYNFITGDGTRGPGTLYPVFLQTSISWNVLQKFTR